MHKTDIIACEVEAAQRYDGGMNVAAVVVILLLVLSFLAVTGHLAL